MYIPYIFFKKLPTFTFIVWKYYGRYLTSIKQKFDLKESIFILFIPQQNPKFLPRRMHLPRIMNLQERFSYYQRRILWLCLASTHNIHSFSGTNIHILKYYQHFFINPKYLWETSVRIFLTLPQSTFKSVGALCLNQPHRVRSQRKKWG